LVIVKIFEFLLKKTKLLCENPEVNGKTVMKNRRLNRLIRLWHRLFWDFWMGFFYEGK